jgi:transcriptional regulator with XRE-family HTH domain
MLWTMPPSPDIMKRLGNRVRELRQLQGYSQEAFADECGLDRTYLSGIERGKRNVSIKNIENIAIALKLSVSELLKGI